MGSWGLPRRRSIAKTIRSHHRKQQHTAHARRDRDLRIEQFEERALLSIGTWTPIGPAPIDYGQTENVAPKDTSGKYLNEVTGAVTAVAAHPTDANILYIGTANGGIWKTSNAQAASPTWTPLTDSAKSLSIGALAFDPTDATGQTLIAGVGRFSDDSRIGGALTGVMRTTDGGANWTALTGGGALNGLNIIGVAIRGDTILVAADNSLTATYASVGIFRSTDGGVSFTQISSGSGNTATGLPGGIAYDLAADPSSPNTFYTAIVGASTLGGKDGVYKTTDAGATWTKVSSAAVDALLASSGNNTTHRVQLSVGKSNQVYVGIVNQMASSTTMDQLAAVFRSGNGGTSWTQMDVPKVTVKGVITPVQFTRVTTQTGDALGTLPSGQGAVDFSIVADPNNANVVYIGCEAQPAIGADSSIGATDYSGLLFRGDASKTAGSQWVSLTNLGTAPGGTKNNSSPHAESRDMTFNAAGRLIEADDGGVYLRTSPADRNGDWYSLNGNLQIAEIATVGYDSVSDVAVASAYDTGVAEEVTAGGLVWNQVAKGSGGEVVVDDASLASQNQSYRYTAGSKLTGFQRQTFDSTGKLVSGSTVLPALKIANSTKTFADVDGGQTYTPIAVNAVDPSRMVIGGSKSVYESTDRCETLTSLGAVANANAIVYGGYQAGVANANLLWVASSSGIYLRTTANGALTQVSSVAALDIAVDPKNWNNAYVVTATSILYTANAGVSWTNITGAYAAAAGAAAAGLHAVTLVGSGKDAAVVVAGTQGLYVCQSRNLGTWYTVGAGMPNIPVFDVTYNAQDNILIAGTLGRGVWELSDPLTQIYGSLELLSVSTNVTTYQTTDRPTITVSPTQLTLKFNDTTIDATTLSGVQITSAGADGKFYDPVTNPYDTDDFVVTPGYSAIGDLGNQIVMRFSQSLSDGLYRVTIVGQGWDGVHTYYGPDGKAVSPLTNTAGMPVGFAYQTPSGQASYWDGANTKWDFNLTLAPQITAVVPQPIIRLANGSLYEARDQIQVYYSGAMDATSAQTLSYYSLIATGNTANTSDDVVIHPVAAVYDAGSKMVTLTFSGDLATLIANPGSNSLRLRIGSAYAAIGTASGGQMSNVVTTDRSVSGATLINVGSTYVAAGDLGNFSTYTPVAGSPLPSSTPQSWILSGNIGDVPYSAEWPGGQDTPGERTLPTGATDVAGENHSGVNSGDQGPTGLIPTYYYNFQSVYGTYSGQAQLNQITPIEKQRVREIFSLFTQYFGAQFVETASQGITVAVGDLRVIDPTIPPSGTGSAAGMATNGDTNGKAIVNGYYDWGTAAFGGSFMITMMHEIMHTLGFGHSYDLSPYDVMGASSSGVATTVGTTDANPDASLLGNGDIVTGQYLYRNDSMDIDLYKFQVDKEGTFSAETIAQRLQNASLLNTTLTLYNSAHEVIARNDDYYGQDSLINVHLTPGTYYIGISSSGNNQYDPDIADSGIGGTTEGAYELRLNFTPQVTDQLVDTRGIALDGDADGAAGGQHNFWFNVNTASTMASNNHTLVVDKASASSTADGTIANPYKTISAALSAAKAGDIIRIVGNNFDNDNNGRSIQAVAAAGTLLDGQKFTISDATKTFTFELDTNNSVAAGNIRVAISSTDSAATIATKLAAAINSVSWIPPNLGQAGVTRYYGGLDARATVTGANNDIVSIEGPTVNFSAGTSKLKTTMQDNQAYEIGTSPAGATLSDGKIIDLPKGVTMIIDAGAVLKFEGANIDVGSTNVTVDRTLSALQVLGTPGHSVYFTSYKDETIGVDTYSPPTTAAAGDWGGLLFANDYDAQQSDPTYQVLEREGIFLDYVNHADIRYGGGRVSVSGSLATYDPITMIDARPTVSYTTITQSADAAMSADPRSLTESEFYERFGETVYTADYGRVGPALYGNTLTGNSLNALFLRIATNPGQATEEVDVPARFDDIGTVLAVPENVSIKEGAGEAVANVSTCALSASGHNLITLPTDPTKIADAQYFYLSDGDRTVRFEIDTANNGVHTGSVKVDFFAGVTLDALAKAINDAASTYGLLITAKATTAGVVLSGTGKTVWVQGLAGQTAQAAGRLAIDPGAIVKLSGTRVEVGFGAQFIAEGTAAYPIVFTSLTDDSYGAGGSFDTNNNGTSQVASAGNWGGFYFSPTSEGSLDYVKVLYAGGSTAIEGGFATFAPVEVRQATVRIADSLFQHNAASATTSDRNGRGEVLQAAVIYGVFSQPILVNNIIRDNQGAAISLDVNSLNSLGIDDWGRSTGDADLFSQYDGNYGPLVRGNRLTGNTYNGMVVRAGTLTTEGVWDDTDIVHVVLGTIDVPNLDTYGGLRLQSNLSESLVVKLSGATAGFTASGRPLEITDRVGGTLQVLGTVGHPVVLTALADDTIGAGLDPSGNQMLDTDNSTSTAVPGDWSGITLAQYSNDRNVGVVNETELATGLSVDINGVAGTAQYLGQLAADSEGGDDTLRLGFDVHGTIAYDRPTDADVYSFKAYSGTEVWIAIDRTSFSLDTVLELIDADGNVLARSDSWRDASTRTGIALSMDKGWGYSDVYSTNPKDAGFRLVLPGAAGDQRTYYLRVSSAAAASSGADRTSGHYQLQVRLTPTYEHSGSTVQYADIRYAVNGIEVLGLPSHSVLTTDVYDTEGTTTSTANNRFDAAQPVGNLLQSDQGMVNIGGYLSSWQDVDWYKFTIDYNNTVENIQDVTSDETVYPIVMDLDFADGLVRPDTAIWVFDENGSLIYKGTNSNVVEDQAGLGNGSAESILGAGSYSVNDPYIGPLYLKEGHTYFVAVTTTGATANGSVAAANPTLHYEPLSSITALAQDYIGSQESATYTLFPGSSNQELNLSVMPYGLNDVTFYVMTDTGLTMVDPFTGAVESVGNNLPLVTTVGETYGDLMMRNDGKLYTISRGASFVGNDMNAYAGLLAQIDTGNPSTFVGNVAQVDGIVTYRLDPTDASKIKTVVAGDPGDAAGGIQMEAATYTSDTYNRIIYAIGNDPLPATDKVLDGASGYTKNLLYTLNEDGQAYDEFGDYSDRLVTNIVPLASLTTDDQHHTVGKITGLAFLDNALYCVSEDGGVYEIRDYNSSAFEETGDGEKEALSIAPNTTSPNVARLHYIGTVMSDGATPAAVAFAGLTAGPADVNNGAYAHDLFAVSRTGELYALQVTSTSVTKAAIFVDGATSVKTNLGSVSGLAFSTLDYNLWHASQQNYCTADPNDATPGGTSFYFGLEENASPAQGGIGNYSVTNRGVYNTYNLPGGAHGSVVTQAFSLKNYTAADLPVVDFHYALDMGTEASRGGVVATADAATIYASADGVNWTLLGEMANTNGAWSEQEVSLADFAGQDNVQLRFDFTTGGQFPNTVATSGYNLTALDGEHLEDGDTFTVSNADGSVSKTFEFDMGISLHMPNVAGDAIPDGETFTVGTSTGNVIFEFDKDGVCAAGHIAIAIQAGETSVQVAQAIAIAVNGQNLKNSSGVAITADQHEDRVMLNGAMTVTQSATPTVTIPTQNNGSGSRANASNVFLAIDSGKTAAEVAEIIGTALNTTFANGSDVFQVDKSLVYLIDHTVTDPGPLAVVQSVPESDYNDEQFYDGPGAQFLRGVNNNHSGLYLDDVIVGFAERGEQYTGATANSTNFTFTTPMPADVTTGYYELQIRRASDYGTWAKDDSAVTVTRTFDTNDRLDSSYTLTVPAPIDISNGEEFTIGDGVHTLTFQLLDPAITGVGNPEDIAVNFAFGDTAADVAAAIVKAINDCQSQGLFNVTATTNGVSNLIDLFEASSVTGIPTDITVTAPAGKDIPAGMMYGISCLASDGSGQTVTMYFQFANSSFSGGVATAVSIDYSTTDTAAQIAGKIVDALATAAKQNSLFNVTGTVGGLLSNLVTLTDAIRITVLPTDQTAIRFEETGDSNQLYDQGQILLENNRITYSSQWGIVVGPGAMTTDTTGFDTAKPLTGPVSPLLTINAQQQVPGVTIENNVIAYGGVGGIHISGDAGVGGQSIGSVPFARIVNNTIYQGVIDTSGTGGSSGGSGSSSVSHSDRLSDFHGDTSAYEGTTDATPVGTTYMVTQQYGGTWYDAEKQLPDSDTEPGTGDDYMCWAASASDVLAWTGWGDVNGMTNADEMFKHFQDHWTDLGGWTSNAWYWWFTGINETDGEWGCSSVDVPGGGNFYPTENIEDYIVDTTDPSEAMTALDQYLRSDYGVGLGIGWIDSWSGHAITAWGFTYDATKSPTDPDYYTGIYVTDSDDYMDTWDATTAPDQLRYYRLEYSEWYQSYFILGLYGEDTAYIDEVCGLRAKDSTSTITPTETVPKGVGIQVDNNASPTILNNVVAKCVTAIDVSADSATTIVGTTSYFGNTANLTGVSQTFAQVLHADPFVDAIAGNFYPDRGSSIIDSSLDSLMDRPNMVSVLEPLGLTQSPIEAPTTDQLGQLRVDDPTVSPPQGLGKNTYKDRGAIDRADVTGPTGSLANPLDNDSAGVDRNPEDGNVTVAAVGGSYYSEFDIQLSDVGAGIADYTVTTDNVTVYEDGLELIAGRDYFFSYDAATDQIKLLAAGGIWAPLHTYVVLLDNSAINDIAGNRLEANRGDGTTSYSITLAGYDYGDAPMYTDIGHTVSATSLPDGARHLVDPTVYLGSAVDAEGDARLDSTATADVDDDGIVFKDNTNLVSETAGQAASVKSITVTASVAGVLHGWVDWNGDGVWESTDAVTWTDANGNALSGTSLTHGGVNVQAGANTLYFTVPTGLAGAGVSSFETFARFRYSTTGLLSDGVTPMKPTGEALDGEVEDYQVTVVLPPGAIAGAVWNDYNGNGAADTGEAAMSGWTIYLDANNNGKFDTGEVSTTTDSTGHYLFTDVIPGDYHVRQMLQQPGWVQTGSTGYLVTVNNNQTLLGIDFSDHETVAPTVKSIVRADASPTNAASVAFTVTFSEPVTGVDASDFNVVVSGLTGTFAKTVTGSGDTYTVTVTTGIGEGTLQLNLADNDSILDLSGNALGGTGANNGAYTGPSYTIDRVAPTVRSIELNGASPTRADNVSFTVTFNEPVTGVDASDFQVITSGLTGTFAPVVAGSDSIYIVTVPTGAGLTGTLQLNLVDNDSILDLAGNPLGGSGTGNGNFVGPDYTIDRTVPMVGWNAQASGTGDDVGQAITTDALGNVYVIGTFHGTVDFDPTNAVYNLTSAGGADIFVAKYSYDGSLAWAHSMGGATDDFGNALALTADGSICIAGSFTGTANFATAGTTTVTATGSPDFGTQDIFVAKLDTAGNLVWVKNMGGKDDDVANGIAVGSDGAVYTTGYFKGTADFDPSDSVNNLTAIGPKDVFVSKLDADGNFVWAERMGGTGWAQGMSIGNSIAVSTTDDTLYLTGSFQGTADFDPSASQYTLSCAGDTDVFVEKLDSAGNFVWARRMGGSGADYGASVVVDAAGNVYTTGDFVGQADFDPGSGSYLLNSSGYQRTFISKLNSSGNFVWARAAGGTGWDLGAGIAVDSAGSVYTTGGFMGIADFDPGAGTYNLTSLGQKDVYILKLDSSGNFAWARRMGGVSDDAAYGIAVGSTGIVYTTGYYGGAADFDAGTSVSHFTSAGGKDLFVTKFIPPTNVLTATVNQGAAQTDPTASSPIVFRVVFSNPVADFAASDLLLGGTAGGTLVATVTPVGADGTTYDVSVTGMTSSGTVTAAIAVGTVHDSLGNANLASTSTDNTVSYSLQPTFTLTGPTSGSYAPGATIPINWNATGASSDKVTLYYDRDSVWNGNEVAIEVDKAAALAGVYNWATPTSLASGTYYVAGYLYSGGKPYYSHLTQPFVVQQSTPVTPTFSLTGPASKSYTAGATVPIQWTATNAGASDKVTLFLDKDGVFNGNETAIEVDQAAASAGVYNWATSSSMAAGSYYIGGYLYSGGKAYYSHLSQSFTIQSGSIGTPSFNLTAPTSGAYTAGGNVQIQWNAANYGANDKVTLYLDRDGVFNGNESPIEVDQAAASAGSYSWTTPSGLASGSYYIAGYLYSGGKPYYSHLTQSFTVQNNAGGTPSFNLTGPTSGAYAAGATIPVQWSAANYGSSDKVTLYLDRDGVWNGNETPIEVDQATASSGTYNWATPSSLASGTYYIAGYLYSGGKPYYSHLTQSFTVQSGSTGTPSFALTGPASKTYTAGSSVQINWTASNAASNDKVTLYYDRDGLWNGNETVIEVDKAAASAGAYTWTTSSNLASGTYYVAGYLYSGGKPYYSHLSQSFTIASPLSVAATTAAPAQLSSDEVLDSQDELTPIVNEAIQRMAAATGSSQILADVSVKIADLPGTLLGEQIGKTILVDRDAAGYGWFVDSTPNDDAEFTRLAADVLVAKPQTNAAGRADLLTTVMHELGHVVGYEHDAGRDLMSASLPVGERRFLASGTAYMTALAARGGWDQPAVNSGLFDHVFASSEQDGKRDSSWL